MNNYKLGKLAPRIDNRTIKFRTLLVPAKLPALPETYDIHTALIIRDENTDNNTKYGDCVVAASTHQIRCFEKFETGAIPDLPLEDIVAQYLKETGGEDIGLVGLDHLNLWRREGLYLGGKYYKIHAFAGVDWLHHDDMKYCIYLLRGLWCGIALPKSAETEFNNGQPWTKTIDTPGSWGLHAVFIYAWNDIGPIILTWGKPQQATWLWSDKYIDEGYGIIDAIDEWLDPATSPLDMPLLEQTLQEITGELIPPPGPDYPQIKILKLPVGYKNEPYDVQMKAIGGAPPYFWSTDGSVKGELPFGLFLSSDGIISGIPNQGNISTEVTLYCRDTQPLTSAIKLTLQIKNDKPICPWLQSARPQARERNKQIGIGG